MRLASGNRITQSADDPAGLAISEAMRSKIRSYKMAGHNAANGVSMLQVAEGTMNQMSGNAIRLRELAMQSANATWNDHDRQLLSLEFDSVRNEIKRQAASAEFNGARLLQGSDRQRDIQVGLHNHKTNDRVSYKMSKVMESVSDSSLGGASISTATGAQNALKKIDDYIQNLNQGRAIIGSHMKRLESIGENISTSHRNHSAGRGRIADTDYALSTAKRATETIKMDTSASVTSQAANFNKSALRLL